MPARTTLLLATAVLLPAVAGCVSVQPDPPRRSGHSSATAPSADPADQSPSPRRSDSGSAPSAPGGGPEGAPGHAEAQERSGESGARDGESGEQTTAPTPAQSPDQPPAGQPHTDRPREKPPRHAHNPSTWRPPHGGKQDEERVRRMCRWQQKRDDPDPRVAALCRAYNR